MLQSACQVKKTNKLSFKETKKKTFASLHMHCTAESKKNTENPKMHEVHIDQNL